MFQFSPGAWLAPAVDWLNTNLHPLNGISVTVNTVVEGLQAGLLLPPSLLLIAAVGGLAWRSSGGAWDSSRSLPSASASS